MAAPKGTTRADKKKIADLVLNKRLSQGQAAKLSGLAQSRVSEIIQEVKKDPNLQLFCDNKDKVLEAFQLKLLNLADDSLLKTMLSKRGFTDVAILQDKIQLLRGQSVSIHDVNIRVLLDAVMPGYQGNSGPVMDAEVTNPLIQANAPLPDKAIPPEDSPDVP
jgi:predicted transcriptional regulator